MVTYKSSVRHKTINYELLHMLYTLVYLDRNPVAGQPAELVVTSANDSTHMAGSQHYADLAIDVRSKTFKPAASDAFLERLRHELGPDYTVLYEGDGTPNAHFHLQRKKGQ